MRQVLVLSGLTLQHACSRDAADITKKAPALFPQRLVDTGAKIIGMVHDEIILEVPEWVAGKTAVILKDTTIQAGQAYLSKVMLGWGGKVLEDINIVRNVGGGNECLQHLT
jgi:hypothetical protein